MTENEEGEIIAQAHQAYDDGLWPSGCPYPSGTTEKEVWVDAIGAKIEAWGRDEAGEFDDQPECETCGGCGEVPGIGIRGDIEYPAQDKCPDCR